MGNQVDEYVAALNKSALAHSYDVPNTCDYDDLEDGEFRLLGILTLIDWPIEVCDEREVVGGWLVLFNGNMVGTAIPCEGDSRDCWFDGRRDLRTEVYEMLCDLCTVRGNYDENWNYVPYDGSGNPIDDCHGLKSR